MRGFIRKGQGINFTMQIDGDSQTGTATFQGLVCACIAEICSEWAHGKGEGYK